MPDDVTPDDLMAMTGRAPADEPSRRAVPDHGGPSGGAPDRPGPARRWFWIVGAAVVILVVVIVVWPGRSGSSRPPVSAATGSVHSSTSATPSGTTVTGPRHSATPSAQGLADPKLSCGSSSASSDLVTWSKDGTVDTMTLKPTSKRGAWVMFSCVNEGTTAVTLDNANLSDTVGQFYVFPVKDRTLTPPPDEFETTPSKREAIAGPRITVQPGEQFVVLLIADKVAHPDGSAQIVTNAELQWESAANELTLLQVPWGAKVTVPQ